MVTSLLSRIVCLSMYVRKAGATAAAAAVSLLLSSGFGPASPNVSHCLNGCLKNHDDEK